MTRRPRRARGLLLLAPALVLALVASGCGGGDEPKARASSTPSPTPSVSVSVPAGVTLTKAGEKLSFGQPAVVAYQANDQRRSVLQLSVDSVQLGKISDLAAYTLSAEVKRSRPYYVRVSVKNLGTGDMSRMDIPLYAVDDSNALNQPSSFNNTFERCPSQKLPANFTQGRAVRTCLVYLIKPGEQLDGVSYRPLQDFEPITWTGRVLPPAGSTTQRRPPKDTKKQ